MRQIVFDVETTGLEASAGHRIIEIGAVEVVNRRLTGQKFHRFVNPEREIDSGAIAIHGIDLARLVNAPKFADIATELLAFISGAELVIHNAPFDVGFLDAELARLPGQSCTVASVCRILDTLALARSLHPGQRNSLDALCKRYSVDNSRRELHGALLDAGILVDVYLAMTGGQSALALDAASSRAAPETITAAVGGLHAAGLQLMVQQASEDELRQHEALLALVDRSSGGRAVWKLAECADADGTHRNQ